MKNVFKNRGLGFYMNLIAGATALLGAVLYIVLDGTDKTFTFIGFALAFEQFVHLAFHALDFRCVFIFGKKLIPFVIQCKNGDLLTDQRRLKYFFCPRHMSPFLSTLHLYTQKTYPEQSNPQII